MKRWADTKTRTHAINCHRGHDVEAANIRARRALQEQMQGAEPDPMPRWALPLLLVAAAVAIAATATVMGRW